jgi:hypothetical protein
MICPGLGQAYNGQSIKALVYFAVFVGLFQMAVLTAGTPLFVLGFIGMWFFSALDSWRTAAMIRSGITPDVADDILVKRFSGNPKLWGIILAVLGVAFLVQRIFGGMGFVMRGVLPLGLIGLGVYLLRGYIFKDKPDQAWTPESPSASFAISHQNIPGPGEYDVNRFSDRSRTGSWRDI